MQRVIYCSRAIDLGQRDIEDILDASVRNNSNDNITGMLLFNAGYFLQLLEGGRAEVTQTFCRISNDPRHAHVELVSCETVTKRLFPAWGMHYVTVNGQIGTVLKQYQAGGDFLPHRLTGPAAVDLCRACAHLQ